MKFKEFDVPRSHLVIDDFLSPGDLRQVWAEVLALEQQMHIGLPGGDDNRYNDIKNNRNAVLIPAARIGGRKNRSTGIVERTLSSPALITALEDCREPAFRLLKFCRPDALHFSSYKNGQFYGAHPDFNDPVNLTIVVFLCGSPKRFSGGDFRLFFKGASKTIPFKNNRAVIFPSNTVHEAMRVRMKSERFRDRRVTLQVWPKLEHTVPKTRHRASPPTARDRSKELEAYLLPHFGVGTDLWNNLTMLFRFIALPDGWQGTLDELVRNPSAAVAVLASNLKYLGREFFEDRTIVFDSGVVSRRRGVTAHVTARVTDGDVGCSFGYALRRSSSGLALNLFARASTETGDTRERRTVISSDADYVQTRAALRRLFRGLVVDVNGSRDKARVARALGFAP